MRWFEHCQVSLFGEDGEVGHKDQRRGWGMLCRRQCRPYLFGHFLFSCQSADGGNEDVDDDNETWQIECWSF